MLPYIQSHPSLPPFSTLLKQSFEACDKDELKNYDVFGCSRLLPEFPTFSNVNLKFLNLDMKKMGLKADVVCVKNAHDTLFNLHQISKYSLDNNGKQANTDYDDVNTTSIGNLAFMATYPLVPLF
jgi:hypothetical protein